jgi:signal transduction histidine kinase
LAVVCRESAAAANATPGVPVECDLEPNLPVVTTDAERLRIVLVNMLMNARQSTDGEGSVTLRARTIGDRVHLTIADHGVGIAASDLPHIFDPYFTTKRGGTGLGLPIAKNIVEGLGGTISVTSVIGRGTEFRIELPTMLARDLQGAAGAA